LIFSESIFSSPGRNGTSLVFNIKSFVFSGNILFKTSLFTFSLRSGNWSYISFVLDELVSLSTLLSLMITVFFLIDSSKIYTLERNSSIACQISSLVIVFLISTGQSKYRARASINISVLVLPVSLIKSSTLLFRF
jgi:hypothetical protein